MKKFKTTVVVFLLAMIVLSFCSCNNSSHKVTGKEFNGEGLGVGSDAEHIYLKNKMAECEASVDKDTLYELYMTVKQHAQKHKECDILNSWQCCQLLKTLFYGEWVDQNGNCRIKLYQTSEVLLSGLPSSKVSGEEYNCYFTASGGVLVIGFESKRTGQRIDNYSIRFRSGRRIALYNLNNGITSDLSLNEVMTIEEKAYWYLIMTIENFAFEPQSVRVLHCEVRDDTVYVEVSEKNVSGEIETNEYRIYMQDNDYYWAKGYYTIKDGQIDLDSLNTKIYKYLNN